MIELDQNTSVKNITQLHESVKKEFQGGAGEQDDIVFDFGALKRMDLATAQVVIGAVKKAREQGRRVCIKSAGEDIRRQFAICGLKL